MEAIFEAVLSAVLELTAGLILGIRQGLAEYFGEVLLSWIFTPLLDYVCPLVTQALHHGFFLPVSWAVCTPFVLIDAATGAGRYGTKVKSGFRTIRAIIAPG